MCEYDVHIDVLTKGQTGQIQNARLHPGLVLLSFMCTMLIYNLKTTLFCEYMAFTYLEKGRCNEYKMPDCILI